LELTLAHLRTSATWRTDHSNGTWVTDRPFGPGTFTVVGVDGADTNGDLVVTVPAEGDGDLDDDPADLLTLSVTGAAGNAKHIVRAVVTPGSGYVENFQKWKATATDAWQTKSLAGAPFNVPANAVVEVAVRNARTGKEQWGGVRAVGSVLDRRVLLHEAEGSGWDILVMHVQTDSNSAVQHYTQHTTHVAFYLLGYWTSGTYVERWQSFKAGADGAWQNRDLGTYGVTPGSVAEIVLVNNSGTEERAIGVRGSASVLERRIVLHEAESGGGDFASMSAQTSLGAGATVQVYAQSDADVGFYVAGYWSTPPGTYAEAFLSLGSPAADATWQDVDLTSFGVPGGGVAEVVLANLIANNENDMGVRRNGSSLARSLDIHEGEAGGGDYGRMHVMTDGSGGIEFYHQDVSDPHAFWLTGVWQPSGGGQAYAVRWVESP